MAKIKITPVGHHDGKYTYVSMHDARPTAPNGTLWHVSKVDGDTAHIWTINAWGSLLQEKCNVSFLREAK